MYAAYHTHQQGSMTCFDEASRCRRATWPLDLGHSWRRRPQGGPLDFLNKFHDRISSFHIKDRTTVRPRAEPGVGHGETPLKEMLRLVRDKKWDIPASIELSSIPADSDAVKEVKSACNAADARLRPRATGHEMTKAGSAGSFSSDRDRLEIGNCSGSGAHVDTEIPPDLQS
jgi:sugar phosphate isomerase/epimerase